MAEGQKQVPILEVKGRKATQSLVAEGFAVALRQVFDVARTVDSKTMALQCLDTLKSLGAGQSTKSIFPMEFTSLLKPLAAMATDSAEK